MRVDAGLKDLGGEPYKNTLLIPVASRDNYLWQRGEHRIQEIVAIAKLEDLSRELGENAGPNERNAETDRQSHFGQGQTANPTNTKSQGGNRRAEHKGRSH